MFNLQALFVKTTDLLSSVVFKVTHRIKSSFFTRNSAKLTFERLIGYLLTLPRGSAQIEINNFFRELGADLTMAKQSLFEAREKLSYTAFLELNDTITRDIYSDEDYKKMFDYRLIAVDGSVFDVPSTATSHFGGINTVSGVSPKAQVLAFVDVLNDIILQADIKPYGTGETNMCYEQILDCGTDHNTNDLFLFDRGFFSRKLAYKLMQNNKSFLFRVSSMSLKEINNANNPDQIVFINDKEYSLKLRVINVLLETGVVEKLATNIFDESISVEDFKNIYNSRWGIEVSFLILKERIQIENFSSAKELLILQDFYAAIFVANLVAIACNEASAKIDNYDKKYEYKPNKNIALSEIRNLMFKALLSDNQSTKNALIIRAQKMIRKYSVPIRPKRSFDRSVKHKSVKFPLNAKRNS